MLTACKNELPNPHANCVRETLNALVCHDNDHRRLSIELRNLQNEFKEELRGIEFRCSEIRKPRCQDTENFQDFKDHIEDIDKVNECFTSRIKILKQHRQEILDNAKNCLITLNAEKCKFKSFHEKTIDYLKKLVVKSDDPTVIRNCEKDICEMQKMFIKEVTFIKNCENGLQPFYKHLQDTDFQYFCNCCCFKDYEWIPQEKSLAAVEEIAEKIKNTMGNTLVKALAQMHIQQPQDVKSFLAAYLMNVEHNEQMLKEKLTLFGVSNGF